jgi:hypothetical protein
LCECVYVFNPSGSTITAGSMVQIDTDGSHTRLSDMALPVANTTTRAAIPLGIVLTDIAASGFGFVVTRGKVYNVRKDSSAVTIGQAVVPLDGSGNDGKCAGNNSFGGSAIGVWLENTSATTATAYLFGMQPSSYGVFRNNSTLLLSTTPPTMGTWSGSFATPVFFTWPIDNAGTKAHLLEARVTYGPSERLSLALDLYLAVRPDGAGGDAVNPTLWPAVSGLLPGTSFPTGFTANLGFRGFVQQFIVPHSTGTSTRAEFFVTANMPIGAQASLNLLLIQIWDRGHVAGGAVL